LEAVTLSAGGLDRRYLLARPPAAGPAPPAVVFLHGTGGTAAWADAEAGWSTFAAREGFVLALPEGVPVDPRKPPKFLTNPPRWNDGSTTPGDRLHTEADDAGFLAAVVEDVLRRTGAAARRVCLSGFSNGAGMAFRFAAERADLVAAVAPVAGHCWVRAKPARPVPTLYLVGTADPLIPLHGGEVRSPWGGTLSRRPAVSETLARWAAANGCDQTPRSATQDGVRTDVYPGPVELRAVFVEGLGHHWPGGRGQLNPKIGGAASDRVDANAAIWEFFRRHSL
jgi:polyhydroxybutyrate depolymerase